jgi:mono/diheme cytochrome c family protein
MFRERPDDSRHLPDPLRRSPGVATPGLPVLVLATTALLAGCVQEMANQPRIETLETARFFGDGQGSRPQVQGTMARGQSWELTPVTSGKQDDKPLDRNPLPLSFTLLERGRELFDINCDHCHGPAGYGDGMVVQRGFPPPPSYHSDRLRSEPDGRLFEVITEGHGRMPAFRQHLDPPERWAIVAYVRALQLSQYAKRSDLSESDRNALDSTQP